MKAMRIMSIIGLILFSLTILLWLLVWATPDEHNSQAAAGWAIISVFYAFPYSIVGIISTKSKKLIKSELKESKILPKEELLNLFELKQKGVITEDEFNSKKAELLK